jgi:general secretion pathway protein K
VRQRGVALIMAVVLVAIATVLSTRVGTEAALDLRRTTGIGALNQGWQVGLGAEAWAAQVLNKDLGESQTDNFSEQWAQPIPPLPIDGGSIEGSLEDMQARFNVNNLVKADGTIDEVNLARFKLLLRLAGLDERWAGMLADWLDTDTVETFPDGAEDGVYISQVPPYRTANGRINVCTASPLVLAAIVNGGTDFGDAEALARNREGGCFPRLDDLKATLGADQYQALQDSVAENTNWFRLLTTVSIGTSQLTLYSLLERNNAGGVRTVLRSIGTE